MLRRNLLAISVAFGRIRLVEHDVGGQCRSYALLRIGRPCPRGATIVVDGGSSRCSVSPYDFQPASPNPGVTCGQRYSPLTVGQNSVTIVRSTETGRDGTVVIYGGRDTPLPYCYQTSYSATNGAAYGIDFGSHSGVVIDGRSRSGIVVRGVRNGVRMGLRRPCDQHALPRHCEPQHHHRQPRERVGARPRYDLRDPGRVRAAL